MNASPIHELGRITTQIRSSLAEQHGIPIDIRENTEIARELVLGIAASVSRTLCISLAAEPDPNEHGTVLSLGRFIYEHQREPSAVPS